MILNNLIDNINDAILAVDTNFDIIEYNSAFLKGIQNDLNLTVSYGDNILKLLSNKYPQWYISIKGCFERALRGERFSFIFDNPSANLWKHIEVAYAPLSDQDGNIMGATLFAHNITRQIERRKAIENMVKSSLNLIGHQYFEFLTDQLSRLFNVKYAYIGKVEENNNQISTIALRKDGDLTENFSYSLPGTVCQTVLQKKETRYIEKVALLFPQDEKLKKWKAESYLGIPITSPAGESLGILVLINDQPWQEIPDEDYLLAVFAIRAGAELYHQKADQQLRQKESQLSRLSKHAPEMIFEYVLWPDGSEAFLYVSEASREIFELEPEALLQDPSLAWQTIHPDDLNHFAQQYQQLSPGHHKLQWIGRIRTLRSGKEKWVKITSTPESVDNGIIKSYGIIDDISAQMEVEQALWKAKEEAEQAARAKEEFLAHMSHEIRTPLNAILGISHLLLQKKPRKDQLQNLNTLKFSSENLMHLINDILDFSKLEAGKMAVDEGDFDIIILLDSLYQTHKHQAHEHHNKLHFDIDEEIPAHVKGDQLKLSQILHNLLSNAIKFTHQGSITVEVKLHEQKKENIWLYFSVKDTGIGIPEDKQTLIFEKFTQADSSTVRQYGGTGLGLTITKMLLELMGSSIHLESELGKGSNFFFTLQLKKGNPVHSPSETLHSILPSVALQHAKILLVEDVDVNRMVITQFLENWRGITIDEVINGKEAVQSVQQKEYDIILMDVRMPVMDGYEAAKQIRNLPAEKYKHIPIIAITADTIQDMQKREETAYFTDVLTKPFDPEDLQRKISKYIPVQQHQKEKDAYHTLSYSKVSAFFKEDPQQVLTFYEKAQKNLREDRKNFQVAIAAKDIKQLSHIKHKTTVLLDMLEAENLKALLEKCRHLLKENANQPLIDEMSRKTVNAFDDIITAIESLKSKQDNTEP